ncbi:MAG TPA: hypothetical protein VNA19_08650 [Pyrinomonadaceae bacterium]|jgi:hypothetical protein|nr:hypothetical protein [Pyrinomonadaceae bacterium]
MSTDVTPDSTPTAKIAPTEQQPSQTGVPKKIVNAQTVCNERNEKGKLCNGHIKQLRTGGEDAEEHLRGEEVLFKCQSCGALYTGPPLGHVRDPQKQRRVVETELAALLRAAGGTLPAFKKSATGAWVPVNEPESHAPAAKAGAAKPAATPKPAAAKPAPDTAAAPKPPPAPRAASTGKGIPPPPAHLAPPAGETPEQKRARLARVVAEAKARAGKEVPPAIAAAAASAPPTPARTAPAAATTSGTDSSPDADTHRPAAEAQAATGQASAAPLSPAAATASPAAGAETVADLADDASTELTPGAPPATTTPTPAPAPSNTPAPRAATSGGKGIPPPPAHLAPPAGETHEEKIARLRRIVEEAKARAGK